MAHLSPDGFYTIPDPSDYPTAHVNPRSAANLCNRCGVRIWTGDRALHDAWHERAAVE